MMSVECNHLQQTSKWVASSCDYTGEDTSGLVSTTVHTTQDVGIGAFQCTQCLKVMFYTGSWANFYESGERCPSSSLVSSDEARQVRLAMLDHKHKLERDAIK